MVGSKKQIVGECQWLGHGEVYRLDEATVIKFVKNIEEYADSLEVQYDLRNDSFAFPKEKFFEKSTNKYSGYLMDYVDGIKATSHDFNNILKLIKLSLLLEKDINVVDENRLLITDLETYNALFNEIIKILDTTTYEYDKERSIGAIKQANIKTYNDFMLKILSQSNNFSKRNLYRICSRLSGKFISKYELFQYGHIPFSEMMFEITEKSKILTLQELKKI